MKRLILNADDFCLSPVFNDSIIELAREGSVSSTSLMVDRYNDSQEDQIEALKKTGVGIGLHVEFLNSKNFEGQIQRQFELFEKIIGDTPSHLDIHKTDFLDDGYPVIMQFATDRLLPFANHGHSLAGGITTSKQSVGAIHHSLDKIISWLTSFGEGDIGELVLHPGSYDAECKTSLNYEREVDVTKARLVKKFCNENQIRIISFSNLKD